MTNNQMTARLREMGLQKNYRPYQEPETGTIMLRTRKPAQIINGYLEGCEIALQGNVFKVWTAQRIKAAKYAKDHNLKIRLLDGEAEIRVPAALADEILPALGARVKRQSKPLTEAQKTALMAHSFKTLRAKTIVLGIDGGIPAPLPFPGPGNA